MLFQYILYNTSKEVSSERDGLEVINTSSKSIIQNGLFLDRDNEVVIAVTVMVVY